MTTLSAKLESHRDPLLYMPNPAGCGRVSVRTIVLVRGSTSVSLRLGPPSTHRLVGVGTSLVIWCSFKVATTFSEWVAGCADLAGTLRPAGLGAWVPACDAVQP